MFIGASASAIRNPQPLEKEKAPTAGLTTAGAGLNRVVFVGDDSERIIKFHSPLDWPFFGRACASEVVSMLLKSKLLSQRAITQTAIEKVL